jgi:hypothetical protein
MVRRAHVHNGRNQRGGRPTQQPQPEIGAQSGQDDRQGRRNAKLMPPFRVDVK